jgi:hypothetical protein
MLLSGFSIGGLQLPGTDYDSGNIHYAVAVIGKYTEEFFEETECCCIMYDDA